ncbi:hypothetical protein BgiBS90_011963, partial [Biomphalaria glabrata]
MLPCLGALGSSHLRALGSGQLFCSPVTSREVVPPYPVLPSPAASVFSLNIDAVLAVW